MIICTLSLCLCFKQVVSVKLKQAHTFRSSSDQIVHTFFFCHIASQTFPPSLFHTSTVARPGPSQPSRTSPELQLDDDDVLQLEASPRTDMPARPKTFKPQQEQGGPPMLSRSTNLPSSMRNADAARASAVTRRLARDDPGAKSFNEDMLEEYKL